MTEQIWGEVEAGRIKAATDRMRQLTRRLSEAGETRLAELATSEAERLVTHGVGSVEGRKQMIYGTRSLIEHGPPSRSNP
jgi:hypothetical protein